MTEITPCMLFAAGHRGQYIISRALVALIEKLEEVEMDYREVSDIMDAEYILKELYPNFRKLHEQLAEASADPPTLFDKEESDGGE